MNKKNGSLVIRRKSKGKRYSNSQLYTPIQLLLPSRRSSRVLAVERERVEREEFFTQKMCPTKQKQKQKHRSSVSGHYPKPGVTVATTVVGDWRDEAINSGSLKHVDLHTGTNGWASPPGDLFSLRGPNYLTKKQKIPSGEWLLQPAGVDWLRSNAKMDHVLSRSDNRIMKLLSKAQSQGKSLKTFLIAVNLQVPGREHHSAVFYFAAEDPIPSSSLLYKFIHGDDSFRNQRFKIVNRIVKGPWIVKAAVGNYSACILGKALNCHYHRGENYLEIDVDISSSAIAKAILHLALGYVTAVTIDMGFLVEGQSVEELPERLFGAVRVCQMEMSSATFVETTASDKPNHFQHQICDQASECEDDDDDKHDE